MKPSGPMVVVAPGVPGTPVTCWADAAAQLADRRGAAQQALHREAAHREDDLRLHQLDFALQVAGHLLGRVAQRHCALAFHQFFHVVIVQQLGHGVGDLFRRRFFLQQSLALAALAAPLWWAARHIDWLGLQATPFMRAATLGAVFFVGGMAYLAVLAATGLRPRHLRRAPVANTVGKTEA